jgi:type II secretory pathway component GspD/PulD (secretin)
MQMYEVKFVTAGALQRFIKTSLKGVEAIIPPRTYTPDRGQFIPLNAALSLQAGGGGGQGGAAGGGGAIGGLGAQIPIPAPVAGGEGQDDRENELSRYLILRGPANLVEDAFKLIESIDVKPPQVMVEVNVLETSPTFLQNFGVAYGFGPLQFLEVQPGTPVDVNSFRTDNITKPAGLGTWSRVPWDITATVNALVRDGQAKLLANPRVQVMDNNSASIFIGDTLRVQVAQAGALGAQTIQIQEFPVGIILLIRPKISPDGSITLRVNPVVSSIRSIDSNGLPQTTTREAETTLVLKDAETVTLGGLIREEESSFVQKVPILGDLPIVGELFKTRNRNRQKVDVVVTITTRIIKDAPKVKQ